MHVSILFKMHTLTMCTFFGVSTVYLKEAVKKEIWAKKNLLYNEKHSTLIIIFLHSRFIESGDVERREDWES